MLAGRVLPPILQALPPHTSVPPVATFFNVPRRYVKSNMQVGYNASPSSSAEDLKSPRSLRKSSRIHELRSSATTSPVQPTKEDQLPSPASPSPRASKKRIAHFEADLSESPTDSRVPASASSTGSGELSGHICLCQPEPKIPRPRNAFILYRQHHQHAIVARNPGLSNPEISKIIGENWKAEPEDTKKIWQDLAQVEKLKHQEQYPDYRYQPRRLGKSGSVSYTPGHVTVEKYRCPRCGGRSIKTPNSPFLNTPTLPLPDLSAGHTPTTRFLTMSNLSLESPATRRPAPGPSGPNSIQAPPSAREDAMYSPGMMTPDGKRRRMNNYPSSTNGRRPEASYHGQYTRRESLPPTQMHHSPPNTATTPPPRTPRDAHSSSLDLNLLVPLQHDQSRSVEAMVMSVPYNVKIKVLGRITPALKEPGPSSPAIAIRGAIIAVEGDDLVAVKQLAKWLEEFLAKDRDYAPRVAEPPRQPAPDATSVSFEEYLDLIREWHGKSKEMVKWITTPVTPPGSPSSTSVTSTFPSSETPNDKEHKSNDKHKDKDVVMKDGKSKTTTAAAGSAVTPPASPATSPSPGPKPVIILPTYQLRASDAYAFKIPIQDVYSPMDHWQWMATLWRGTVGPDLTIYVKGAGEGAGAGVGGGSAGGAGSGVGLGRGAGGKLVELNEEGRCLTVVREGKGNQGRFAESALRRVGFEVGEWVRGIGGRAA
ncbi:hypothetical protein K458DRAFT_123371 [Lentithecium fluviatile CBS 122367]|uniref:HMG box domain-containing protein n=1 Tax=Lentithecium fluviatile CBS 122367 TaxID=1168545 RepID=A0A6G1JFZ7_9PLEO|nr:hypothetical protein K458DRAFT_123371 [Lentithecium fluviatile CBS 122367]